MTPNAPSAARRLLDQFLNDPAGFASFVRLVRGISRRSQGALQFDEHLQETVRRALSSADGFAGTSERQLIAWLGVIARRVATDSIRAKRPSRPLDNDLDEKSDPPDHAAESAEEVARVMAVLGQLPPTDQALLLARFRDGLQPRQIARITGLTGEVVRQRLSRSLRSLRILLAREIAEVPTSDRPA